MHSVAKFALQVLVALSCVPAQAFAQSQWVARGRTLTKKKKPWPGAKLVFVEKLPEGFDRGGIEPRIVHATSDDRGNVRARLTSGTDYWVWAYSMVESKGGQPTRYRASRRKPVVPGKRFEIREVSHCERMRVQLLGSEKGFDPSEYRLEVMRGSAPLVLAPDAKGFVDLPLVPPSTSVRVVDRQGRLLVSARSLRVEARKSRQSPLDAARGFFDKLRGAKGEKAKQPAANLKITKIRIPKLTKILVRVLSKKDGKQSPVRGARVIFGDYRGASFVGASDAEGWAVCSGAQLPRGKRGSGLQIYRLECHAEGYAGREGQCAMAVVQEKGRAPNFPGLIEIREGDDLAKRRKAGKPHLTFELKPAIAARGRVLLDGKPLGGARVRVLRKLEHQAFHAGVNFGMNHLVHHVDPIVTAADGTFSYARLRAGETFELVAYLDQRALAALPKHRWLSPLALLAISKAPDKGVLEIGDIDVAKLPVLELQVLTEDGGPAKGAEAFAWARTGPKRWLSLRASRLGRVALRCAQTNELRLAAHASGRKIRSETAVPAKEGQVLLRAPAGVILRGVVRNEKNEPLPGADVYASIIYHGDRANDPLAQVDTQQRMRAGADGRFLFRFDKGAQVFVYGHTRDKNGRTQGRAQQLRLTLHENVDDAVLTIKGARPPAKRGGKTPASKPGAAKPSGRRG